MKAKLQRLVLVSAPLLMAASAHATGTAIDVTDVVADIAAQAAPIGLIGSAVILIFVGLKAFKWVRRALS